MSEQNTSPATGIDSLPFGQLILDQLKAEATIRSIFFSMFGGAQRLDCIITMAANEPTHALPSFQLPAFFQGLASNPRDLVDLLLDQLHDLGVWEYQLECDGGSVRVIDTVTGHVIEERSSEAMATLKAKYQSHRGINHGLPG